MVSPIYKNRGFRADVSNYRPIALTSVACKALESLVARYILQHCKLHGLLDPQQHGFRPKRGTVVQRIDVFDNWFTGINESRTEIDAIYIDFKTAFDMVNLCFLALKLEQFGIPEQIISWVSSFLSNRLFVVRVNSALSDWFPAPSVVPQGSAISPLLFILFTSDLRHVIESGIHHWTYADDTKMFVDVSSDKCFSAL